MAGAVVTVVLFVLVACGDGGVTSADSLPGRTFLSESVTDNGAARPLVAHTRIRLSFDTERSLTATAGCNTLSTAVEITDDRLVIGDLSGTAMGCDQARHDQDTWLAGILTADPAYSIAGDRLTLRAGSTTIVLFDRRVADPDLPLEGTVWQLDGIVDGGTASSTSAGSTATLRVSGGRLTVDITRCSRADTSVEVRTTALVVEPLTLSHAGCAPDAAKLTDTIAAVLNGTVSYRIEAASLAVTNKNGRGLTLRAADR